MDIHEEASYLTQDKWTAPCITTEFTKRILTKVFLVCLMLCSFDVPTPHSFWKSCFKMSAASPEYFLCLLWSSCSPSIVWGVNQQADLFSVLHHSPPTAHSPLSFSSMFWNICSPSRTLIICSACECFPHAVSSLWRCVLHVFSLRSAFAVYQLGAPLRDHVTKKWQSQGTTLNAYCF